MASDGTQHLAPEELERLIFFEAAKEQAKAEVKKNPKDVQALVRWGGALLELAHLKQGHESIVCIEEAVERIEQALEMNSKAPQLHAQIQKQLQQQQEASMQEQAK